VIRDESGAHIVVTGGDRIRFVNGMCMGNVAAIPAGGFLRTAILNPKGRLLSVFDVVPREADLVLVVEPDLVERTRAVLDRHAIADDVAFAVTELAVHRVWSDVDAVWTAPPVFAPPPGPVAAAAALEIRRVEAGLPRYGVDVSEDNFPFETPLARLIDYKKGCYVGQEPVARVAARGNASKQLCGLRVAGPGALAAGTAVAALGKADAGRVTSAAESPSFGSIALAYLPRGAWQPGTAVEAGGRAATVIELPFR
jgi:folate-binding protein YgfZ